MKDKKTMILKFLKKNGQSSTGRIASAIKGDQWITTKYLEVLLKENKIKKTVVPNATYWELK